MPKIPDGDDHQQREERERAMKASARLLELLRQHHLLTPSDPRHGHTAESPTQKARRE